jgi:hypothetical protein
MLVDQVMVVAAFMGREVEAAPDQSVKMEQQVLQGKVVTVRYQVFLELAHRILVVGALEKVTVVLQELVEHIQQQVV